MTSAKVRFMRLKYSRPVATSQSTIRMESASLGWVARLRRARSNEEFDQTRHRVQREHPAPAFGSVCGGADHGCGEEPDLHQERDGVADVAVLDVERGEPDTHPKRRQDDLQNQQRQGRQLETERYAKGNHQHQQEDETNRKLDE